jgi:hypothetical protein
MDATLRTDVPASVQKPLHALVSAVGQTAPDGDWSKIYGEAIQVAEILAGALDERVDELDRAILALPDPNEVRQREIGDRRRNADRQRTEVRTALQKVVTDWTDRLKRQQAQVERQCLDELEAKIKLAGRNDPAKGGMPERFVVSLDERWWALYLDFVAQCSLSWSQQSSAKAEETFRDIIRSTQGQASSRKTPIGVPTLVSPPHPDLSLARAPAEDRTDVPGSWAALGQFLRSNVMTVSMLTMMFGGPLAIAVGMPGDTISAGVKGLLVVSALPVLTAVGWLAARNKRQEVMRKALEQGEVKVREQATKQVQQAVSGHRDRLARWLQQRADAWNEVVDQWWPVSVEPEIAAAEELLKARLVELKLDHKRLSDQQSQLRRFRDDVASRMLFDLRKRQRQLAAARGEGP